jgi:integrase
MERQAERGFIEDVMPWADPFDWAASEGKVPSFHEDPSDFFDAPERPLADQTDTDGVWQPLSDGWLEAAGYRWTYLLKDILPNLVRLAEDWHDLNPRQPTRKRGWGGQPAGASLCKSYIADAKRTLREEYLHEFEWIDSNGDPIERLPFEIAGSRNLPVMWTDLLRLISCTQRSLYCLLLLLTAGRRSEVSSLKRSSLLVEVIEDDTGYSHLHGRSYKLSGFGIGDETAWPIPASVGPYVESWRAFVGLLMGEQSKSFWISMSVRGAGGRPSIEPWPQELSLKLGLDDLAGDGNVHAHRFRKSMARLAVLCLVGAPLILQQILGHDGLATTLKYIFSDPHIREELREILEEIRLDIAITVAEGVDEAGGRGANTIRRARDEFLDKLEIPQNERAQRYAARDFAVAHLAQGGFDLKVVFAGIICIKPPEVPGRCSQFGLKPDFSRCQADCLHFLALPSARASTQITLEWLLAELEDPEIASSELLAPFYRAQFIDQARIFENLRLTYASDPRVCSLFPEAAQRLLSKSAQS